MKKHLRYIFLVFLLFSYATSHAAVVLQYHHVGTDTPRSTSVTEEELRSHLQWLEKNDFEIISLSELLSRIKSKSLNEQAKIASITFDDLSPSICTQAWSILKEFNFPFTVFIHTSSIQHQSLAQNPDNAETCSVQELESMLATGLLQVANHSHTHPHMLDTLSDKNQNKQEILLAQKIINKTFGTQKKIFAYPYGEFNEELEIVIKKLGYTGFGQQSGAIGNNSNLYALPRFPLSDVHANLDRLPDKLLSLPFPIKKKISSPNPLQGTTPELTLYFDNKIPKGIQCFLGDGSAIETIQEKNHIKAQTTKKLQAGRVRYNCTAPSDEAGRYYWYSQQWVYKE